MKKINVYLGHSREIDYNNYYKVIEESTFFKDYNFIFPHKLDHNKLNGRLFYKEENIDIFIAEVSLPSTGLGIEMGYSAEEKIPIYCFYKKGSKPSNAIKSVTSDFIEYDNLEDFVLKVKILLES